MEKTVQAKPVSRYLFETKDYGVETVTVSLDNVPHPALLRKYAIVHKSHEVVAGLAEQFGGAIEAARGLQESHDRAIAGVDVIAGESPIPRPPRGFGGPGTPPQLS